MIAMKQPQTMMFGSSNGRMTFAPQRTVRSRGGINTTQHQIDQIILIVIMVMTTIKPTIKPSKNIECTPLLKQAKSSLREQAALALTLTSIISKSTSISRASDRVIYSLAAKEEVLCCNKFVQSPLLQDTALGSIKSLFSVFCQITGGKLLSFDTIKNEFSVLDKFLLLYMIALILALQHVITQYIFVSTASTAFEILPFARNRNKQIHGLFQTFAIICIIAGYVIIYDCHMVLTNTGLANTTHSIVGYITISLVVLTYVMGFILYILKYGGVLRGELKPLHKRMGIISLILGYTTILMGFTEKANGFDGYTLTFAQVIIGLLVGTSICVSFAVVKFVDKKPGFDYKPIPNPEENNTVHLTN